MTDDIVNDEHVRHLDRVRVWNMRYVMEDQPLELPKRISLS
jgi:hypothetical protein